MRRFFRKWHGTQAWWVSPLVLIVVMTGGVLAFRGYIKTAEPEAMGVAAGEMLGLDEAVAHAQSHAHTQADASEIYVALDPEGTWCVVFDDDQGTEVYMAADGALVEVLVPQPGLTSWMFWLHTADFAGPLGPWISGLLGLLMTWVVASGMVIRLQTRKR
jgi:uncharacterized iron-regulated membrane protein